MGSNNWASSNNWSNTGDKWGSSNNWAGNSNWSNSLHKGWAGNNLSSSWDSDGWSIGWGSSVRNILDNTISVVRVGHSLYTAVGKVDSVASRGSISITSFGLAEVNSRVIILGSIGIVVNWGSIFVDWGRVTISRGRWASRQLAGTEDTFKNLRETAEN